MRDIGTTEQVTETEGDKTEALKTLDVAAIDNPELVSGVQDKLDDVFGNESEKTTVLDEDSEDSTSDETKDDTTAQESDQTDSKDGADNSTSEAETDDGKIDIPDSYMRAAVHHGLDEKTVGELVKKDPELAMKMLESCYLSVNNASREWSAIGRAKIEAERTQAQTTTEAVAEEDPATIALIASLKKEYPDDPLIDTVIAGMKSKVKAEVKPQAQQHYEVATARANAAGNLAIDQRVNTFFSADAMKPYEQFYGKLELGQIPEDLQNGQQLNRLTVLQEAEYIIAGYNSRGQKIEVEQALEKAHYVVTEPIRKQVIRDNLKATAMKRKKSMTFKPSESKRSSDSMNTDSSKPRNRQELEQSVQQNLDKVFKR